MADTIPPTPAESPTLQCDLVMKGGITSGLVYPKAVTRVARDYRIRDIGGTSIGAIAAALTAAAEFWRQSEEHAAAATDQQRRIAALFATLSRQDTEEKLKAHLQDNEQDLIGGKPGTRGFAGLYQIPQEVGQDLLGKFQPQMWTRGMFDFAIGLTACSNIVSRIAFFLFRQFAILRTILALGFILLALSFRANPTHGMRLLGATVALACAAFAVLVVFRLVRPGKRSRRNDLYAIGFNLGALALAVIVYLLLPSRPDLSVIWDKVRDAGGSIFTLPDYGSAFWWVMVGVLGGGIAVILAVYLTNWLSGWWRSAVLAVIPMAMFAVGCHYYATQAGTIGWLQSTLWDTPSLHRLTLAVMAGIAIVLGVPVVRDFILRNAGEPSWASKATLKRILNTLFLLAVLVYVLVMLNDNREAVLALVTEDLTAIPADEHDAYMELQSRDLIGAVVGGAILGWSLGTIVAILYNVLVAIPANHNGLCTGLGTGLGLPRRKNTALTNWLTNKIDVVAERLDTMPTTGPSPSDVRHLTVADLKQAEVKLEAITSDLTRGVPLSLPDGLEQYRFKPAEFRSFFPESVVRQMAGDARENELVPFNVANVPVIVIARMSMSFPILFSTVPVYHPRPKEPGEQGDETRWQRCTLSDGGIVSNFPIHLFDRALSPRPTFAIDLVDRREKTFPEKLGDQFAMSPILGDNRRGMTQNLPMDVALVPAPPPGRLSAFASGILNTARGWMDRSQATLPGYKERIVGIHLYKEQGEGGLNLTMDAASIDRLANRGLFGMHTFLDRWNPDLEVNSEWHQHRWLRYLILMRSLENFSQEWQRGYACDSSPVHTPSVREMVGTNGPAGTPHTIDNPAAARAITDLFDQVAGGGTPSIPTCNTFGEKIPDGAFDAVAELRDREPRLLVIPPFT